MVFALGFVMLYFGLEYPLSRFSGGLYTPRRVVTQGPVTVIYPPGGILAHYWPCLGGLAVFALGLMLFVKAGRLEGAPPRQGDSEQEPERPPEG